MADECMNSAEGDGGNELVVMIEIKFKLADVTSGSSGAHQHANQMPTPVSIIYS